MISFNKLFVINGKIRELSGILLLLLLETRCRFLLLLIGLVEKMMTFCHTSTILSVLLISAKLTRKTKISSLLLPPFLLDIEPSLEIISPLMDISPPKSLFSSLMSPKTIMAPNYESTMPSVSSSLFPKIKTIVPIGTTNSHILPPPLPPPPPQKILFFSPSTTPPQIDSFIPHPYLFFS